MQTKKKKLCVVACNLCGLIFSVHALVYTIYNHLVAMGARIGCQSTTFGSQE